MSMRDEYVMSGVASMFTHNSGDSSVDNSVHLGLPQVKSYDDSNSREEAGKTPQFSNRKFIKSEKR